MQDTNRRSRPKGLVSGPIGFIAAVVVIWFAWAAIFGPSLGLAFAGITGLLFAVFLVLAGHALLGLGNSVVPVTRMWSGIIAAVLFIAIFGIGAITGIFSAVGAVGSGTTASIGDIGATTPPASTASLSLSEQCKAKVSDEIEGTSATLTVSYYDHAADSPLSAGVDISPTNVYRAASLGESNGNNFLEALADTTAGTSTKVKAGDVVTLVGGDPQEYADPIEGICISGQQEVAPNGKGYTIAAESDLAVTVFDDTGSTELAAGTNSTKSDYKTAGMGANEELAIWAKLRVASANKAFRVGALVCSTLNNMSECKPGPESAALFKGSKTVQFLKDRNVTVANTQGLSKTFDVYELKTPVLLTEFQSVKYQLRLKASTNAPVGTTNLDTADLNGVALGFIDAQWVRGSDGVPSLSVHNQTASEDNTGLLETVNDFKGKQVGANVEVP